MPAPFDTLKLAERLGAGGFSPQQAQTAAAALSDALAIDMATKSDLEAARLHLEAKIETSRFQLESKIQESKTETVKWFVGVAGFQTLVILGALMTLLKLFAK